MKKKIRIFGSAILLVAALTLTASAQQGKNNKDKKEQQQNPAKGQAKPGNVNKENPGNNNAKNDQPHGKGIEKGNQGKNDNAAAKGKSEMKNNNGKNDQHADQGKNNDGNHGNNGKDYEQYGYSWNRENFKERQKIRNQDKVTICHKFNSDKEPAVSIRVSANALKAHMNHGDVMGDCPPVNDRRWSDIFLRNRNDYYSTVSNTQDQVYYSRSILDYALGRLTNSRLQLATMQNNNLPLADIQRKQATVVELQQNVSLLETVLGVAATLIANKLQ
jgi:hypothetical protein